RGRVSREAGGHHEPGNERHNRRPARFAGLNEGYGPGAWHGPDMKAALAETAFWRPASGRHNIAEIALHHAFCARSVRARLSGTDAEPFVLERDDWFAVPDASRVSWAAILDVVAREQRQLTMTVAKIADGRMQSPL